MNNIKTILLIGRTGDGKSTLANVISETNKFTEGEFAVSETRKVSDHEFDYKGTKYRIVDTVGIGDTNMTLDKVLRKLALMGYSVKDGLHQILFVTNGQLAREAKSTYDLLRKVVFDGNITKYTTIVRTNFPGFRNEKQKEKEKERIVEENESLKGLINECNNNTVFVDNPQIIDNKEKKENLERREESRKILLSHLENIYQGDIYKPGRLDDLSSMITEDMEKKKKLKEKKWLWKIKNRSLNKKITEKMLEHIGKENPGLKEKIEKWLNAKKPIPIKWLFEEEYMQSLQSQIEIPPNN